MHLPLPLPPTAHTLAQFLPLSTTADLVFTAHTGGSGDGGPGANGGGSGANSGGVAALDFLPPTPGPHEVLVTAGAGCRTIKLWVIAHGASSSANGDGGGDVGGSGAVLEATCSYELQLTCDAGGAAMFNHLVLQPSFSVIILANTPKKQVRLASSRSLCCAAAAAARFCCCHRVRVCVCACMCRVHWHATRPFSSSSSSTNTTATALTAMPLCINDTMRTTRQPLPACTCLCSYISGLTCCV